MAFGFFTGPGATAGRPGVADTTQKNTVGKVAIGNDGSEWIYLAGVASLVDGEVVAYQPGVFTAVRLATGVRGCIAVASAAVTAAKWGWFMIVGQDTVNTPSAIASNVPLFIGGVTGNLDDTAVKGDQILDAVLRSAGSQDGTATIQVNRATVGFSNESTG